MKEIVKKAVENSVTGFLLGKVNDSLINNVMLCWHGECGSLAEAHVVITKRGDDGRYSEGDGQMVALRPYVENVKCKAWFDTLAEDLTNMVMWMVDPDPEAVMKCALDDMRKLGYEIGNIK